MVAISSLLYLVRLHACVCVCVCVCASQGAPCVRLRSRGTGAKRRASCRFAASYPPALPVRKH